MVIENPPIAVAGGGSAFAQRNINNPELLYPRLANAISITNAGLLPWTWSAYNQLVAATVADYYPVMAYMRTLVQPQTAGAKHFFYELEIATGAAGVEILHDRFSDALQAGVTNPDPNDVFIYGRSFPLGPTLIPAGTRIAARIQCQLDAALVLLTSRLYVAGYDTVSPACNTLYNLDDVLNGLGNPQIYNDPTAATLSIAASPYPAYGAWTAIPTLSPAPKDALVYGTAMRWNAGIANSDRHVQFGIGVAGAQQPYAQLGTPITSALGAGQYLLHRPLLVLAGEFAWMRQAGGGFATLHQPLLSDL